jgi:myosin heavy subunit
MEPKYGLFLWMNAERYYFFSFPATRLSKCCVQETSMDTTEKEIHDVKEGLPPLRNPPLLETCDDLATLSHLNEPSGKS